MVMNKKEKEEIELLQLHIRKAKALRYLGVEAPVRLPIPNGSAFVNGWDFNPYSSEVMEVWTGCVSNGRGHIMNGIREKGSCASRDGCNIYKTKIDALVSLRLHKEDEFASALAKIDEKIEQERNNT